jgi:hypothetical protein
MSTQFTERWRGRQLRALLLAACVAGVLALPTAASAMPIDNRPGAHTTSAGPIGSPASPEVRTVIQSSGQTLAIVLAGAALLVAMTSAGYSAVKLARTAPPAVPAPSGTRSRDGDL